MREKIRTWLVGEGPYGEPGALTDVQVGRRFFMRIGIVVAVLVVVLLVLLPLALLLAGIDVDIDLGESSRPPLWRLVTFLVLTVVGFVILTVNFVQMMRSGALGAMIRGPLSSMTRQERRAVMQQIRGRLEVDRESLSTTVTVARLVADTRFLRSLGGLVLIGAGQIVRDPGSWTAILWAAFLIAYVVAAALVTRDARVARSFLARYR